MTRYRHEGKQNLICLSFFVCINKLPCCCLQSTSLWWIVVTMSRINIFCFARCNSLGTKLRAEHLVRPGNPKTVICSTLFRRQATRPPEPNQSRGNVWPAWNFASVGLWRKVVMPASRFRETQTKIQPVTRFKQKIGDLKSCGYDVSNTM